MGACACACASTEGRGVSRIERRGKFCWGGLIAAGAEADVDPADVDVGA